MPNLLHLYHQLPPPLRSIAASMRGFYLHAWRYSVDTERIAEAAIARETWDREQWQTWQEEQIAKLLHRAAQHVPYYRDYWAQRRRQGDRASAEVLTNWPVLEKETLRTHPRAFIADDCNPQKMFHEHTSGTTAKPLDLWWSRQTVRLWYAFSEARIRYWHGLSRHVRWAMLGGQLITSVEQRKPPFWVWNAGLNQLYMSSYHLVADLIPFYLDALIKYRIRYLWGYPSSLYALALGAIEAGRTDVHMQLAVANAEPVFDYQREAILEAFHCPVQETYGMAEIVVAASECPNRKLHIWPEVGQLEVLEGIHPVPNGKVADLVSTGLINVDMPLIRYRIGDRGALASEDVSCTCGRKLPILHSVEGRSDDVLYTSDGRLLGRLDPVFKSKLPIREAQIIQETINRITVRYVPAPGFTQETEQIMADRLRQRVGPFDVRFEQLATIPRTSSGKFRAVVCNLSPEERRIALGSQNQRTS